MSRENVEIVREAYAAFEREGPGAMFGTYWPDDYVWDVAAIGFPGPGVYRGRDEVLGFFREWFGSFDDWHLEPHGFADCGEKVVVFVRQRGRGSVSATDVDMDMTQVNTVRNGRVVETKVYVDRAEALEAVGLRE